MLQRAAAFLLLSATCAAAALPWGEVRSLESTRRSLLQSSDLEEGSAVECESGQVAQYQTMSCDSNGDYLIIHVYDEDDCSGDAKAEAYAPPEFAGVGLCAPSASMASATMSMCSDQDIVTAVYKTADCAGSPFSTSSEPQCKKVCVDPSTTSAHEVTEEQGTCMNDDGSVLDGCTCHPSCGSCGYHVAAYDAFAPCETCDWPATEFDCLTCRDGLVKINLFDDGTGSCVAPQTPQCFSEYGGEAIDGCECFPACASCGYKDTPTGPDMCIACQQGLTLNARYDDGTGSCDPPDMVIVVVPEDQLQSLLTGAARVMGGGGLFVLMAASVGVAAMAMIATRRNAARRVETLPLQTSSTATSKVPSYGTQA